MCCGTHVDNEILYFVSLAILEVIKLICSHHTLLALTLAVGHLAWILWTKPSL